MRIGNSENGEVAAREVCGSVVLSSPLLSNTEEMTAVLEVLQVSYYVGPTTPTRLVAGSRTGMASAGSGAVVTSGSSPRHGGIALGT